MFKQLPKRWVSISVAMMMVVPLAPLAEPTQALAVADTFTLTALNDDTISIKLNGSKSVQLPNGNVTTVDTTFKAPENKVYTFVGIDGAVKVQKSITMTSVPNATPLLIVAPNENVKLRFDSGDAHSGVQDMRYKVYDELNGEASATFTSWEPFTAVKNYTIPSITANTNRNWVVKAEYRDKAGNVATDVVTRFIIENWAPTVDLSQTPRYTNKTTFDARARGVSKFADIYQAKLGLSSSTLNTVYDATSLTNKFSGTNAGNDRNYIYDLPMTIPDAEGTYTVYLKMSKMQNSRTIESPLVSTSVIYDKTKPTGSVVVNSGETTLPSRETTLTINTGDALSGVEKVKIVEKDTGKEKTIMNPGSKIVENWTFDVTDTGQILIIVTDRAGNETTAYSQKITFAKLNINTVELTKNRNPAKYNSQNPFVPTTTWNETEEEMLGGSSFEFGIGYDMGVANTADYTITGEYTMEIEKNGTTYYKSSITPLKPKSGDRLETGKIPIPENMPAGAQIFVTTNLKAVNKGKSTLVLTETTGKKLFGKVGAENLDTVINKAIQFNEIN